MQGDRYAREGEATITLSWNEVSVKITCKARGKDHNFQLPRVNYIIEQVVDELITEVGLEDRPEPKKD